MRKITLLLLALIPMILSAQDVYKRGFSWGIDIGSSIDMTGNNINHPCDFLARIYAQVILAQFA